MDLLRHLGEECRARLGIRVHEDQPVAGSRRGAGVPGPCDLIHRFEDNLCARRPGQFRRPICGVVVANDGVRFPAESSERFTRQPNVSQRLADQALLVEAGMTMATAWLTPAARDRTNLCPFQAARGSG